MFKIIKTVNWEHLKDYYVVDGETCFLVQPLLTCSLVLDWLLKLLLIPFIW